MRKILEQGLGESSTFASFHPAVNFIYFALVIGITMFSMDPVFLAATLAAGWFWSLVLSGKKALKFNLLLTLPIVIVMAVVNTLFTHNGATVLFYLNGGRITLEAFLYGLAAAAMISAVILWFSCFNVVMTSDKFIYLFGKAAPVLGLTLSMVFRFLPLLKTRYQEISMGQKCMGRHGQKGLLARARQTVKEVSILISWSLEASIETSDSMEARGYGLPGRTSFHLFRFTHRDRNLLLALLAAGLPTAAGCMAGLTSTYYYPKIALSWGPLKFAVLASYIILLLLPAVIDISGEKKWQAYKSEI